MKKILPFLFYYLFISFSLYAQTGIQIQRPKLIIGIVVDQMRYDFLYRYYNKYGNDGFKRLMKEGFNCRNHQFNYTPTVTAAGHAAIYTGSIPAINGIVGNNWYDRNLGRSMYCVEDCTVSTVGSTSRDGLMSPRNLLAATITDQLKLASNQRAKVIGIALKDRGAVLPAGHSANAAYWLDTQTGQWITSSYYMNHLPEWVRQYNQSQMPSQLVMSEWTTLLPIDQYTESDIDDNVYEKPFPSEARPVFPHSFTDSLSRKNISNLVRCTPLGNTITVNFAIETIQRECLGASGETDFLTISFSSTDYVGHAFGPYSIEVEDTYLRLDKEIARLLKFLDQHIDKQNLLLFLTADHGVAEVPAYAAKWKLPQGIANKTALQSAFENFLQKRFGEGTFIVGELNNQNQLYLNAALLQAKHIAISQVKQGLDSFVQAQHWNFQFINLHDLSTANLPGYQLDLIKNGIQPERSGDLMLLFPPGWIINDVKGTTHSTVYRYDTHIPLLWYGWHIKRGQTFTRTQSTDIAPTIAALISLQEPGGCVGEPITDMTE